MLFRDVDLLVGVMLLHRGMGCAAAVLSVELLSCSRTQAVNGSALTT
jgi:hypothetical protein